MKKRKVNFLMYFNDYPMLLIFTVDVVVLTAVSFLATWAIMTMGNFKLMITMFASFGVSATLNIVYRKAKKESSKGLLKHWLFNNGFYTLKKDASKWRELKYADNKDYFPTPEDKLFID